MKQSDQSRLIVRCVGTMPVHYPSTLALSNSLISRDILQLILPWKPTFISFPKKYPTYWVYGYSVLITTTIYFICLSHLVVNQI